MMSQSGAVDRTRPIRLTRAGTGAQIGEYQIIRSLGSGGMGQVFAARRISDDECVALKQVSIVDPTLRYRFKQEFRSLADLPHPNLVRLGELVLLPGDVAFFTMELVEGEPLARWVRRAAPAGTPPNLHRLCHALRQLVAGVAHLHRSARVHRDLKPSNVLVTAEGRVVILDFGLIYELNDANARITASGQLLGTPAYMAPEQISQRVIGTAVDLYAIGVTLFECLTGCMPFAGSTSGVLIDKQHAPAPDPRELCEHIPDWLAQLCRALLDVEPEQRPAADTVIEIIDRNVEAAPLSAAVAIPESRLFGRERELAALELAHRQVAELGATVMRLSGPTGRGKSALVDQFLQVVAASDVVLRGRCHRRESVPYKGVDSIVDALALHLRALPEVETAALRPRHVRELCELFPVLRGTWSEPSRLAIEREPAMRRQLGVSALRDVFARIADASALIIVIDEFHWGDLDGLDVLDELLQGSSPPALLLVLVYDPRADSAVVDRLERRASFVGVEQRTLELEPLGPADARALARSLIDPRIVDDVELAVSELARSSGGEPLAIVHGAAIGKPTDDSVATDGEVLRKLRALDAEPRLLLELATVAGVPLPDALVREVWSSLIPLTDRSGSADFTISAYELVMAGLLGVVALDSRGIIKLAQPRVGELVRVELDGERRRVLHLNLALALAQHGADSELIAEHFERGGDRERARRHMTDAARKAADALAFARAERLYRRALELLPSDIGDTHKTDRRELQLALADQLTQLARSPETHAREASEPVCAATEPGPSDAGDGGGGDPSEARGSSAGDAREAASQLRLRAAEQYAVAACSRPSSSALHELMQARGEWLPRTTFEAVAALTWNHLRLLVHGQRVREPAPEQLLSFDLVRATHLALSSRQHLVAAALRPRVMQLARAAGDPLRLVVALCSEVGWLLARGHHVRAARRLAEARQLAGHAEHPLIHAHIHVSSHAYHIHTAQLDAAELDFVRAQAELERCPGEDALLANLLCEQAHLLYTTGAHARLLDSLPGWISQLRSCGRPHDAAMLVAGEIMIRARRGEFSSARHSLARARASTRAEPHALADSMLELAQASLLLAQGRIDESRVRAQQVELELERHGLGHHRHAYSAALAARLRAQLVGAIAKHDARALPRPSALRRLRRGRSLACAAEASILAAGRASLVSPKRELALWREAMRHCQRACLRGHVAAIRWRLVELGAADADVLDEAHAYFRAEDIDDIQAFVDLVAPRSSGLQGAMHRSTP